MNQEQADRERLSEEERVREKVDEAGNRWKKVYFGGDLEAGVALTGQIAGRIDAVKPVAQIFEETVREFAEAVESLSKAYGP